MERIFPNLYRFDFGPMGKAKAMSFTYLLVRKGGNLLVCHCNRGSSVIDYFNEIEELGGIDTQFVAHYHDAQRGDLHDVLYDRFGCKLCYHHAERRTIRTKTRCPEVEFGDDGLKLGSDFKAHYFPGHTPGMSIFLWKHRGKRYLFPSHVIGLRDEEWRINFAPHMAPKLKSQFAKLAKMDIDYLLRGGSPEGVKEYYQLDDRMKKAFQRALRTKLKATPKTKTDNRPRLVTGYAPVMRAIAELGLFEIETPTAYSTCPIGVLENYLAGADVVLFLNHNRTLAPGHEFLGSLRDFVEKGGNLLIGDSRLKSKNSWLVSSHPFPEVAVRRTSAQKATSNSGKTHELVITTSHPAVGKLTERTRFTSQAYEGVTFEPGENGVVLLRNASNEPVCVAGHVGKGRVVLTALHYGNKTPLEGAEKQLNQEIVRWLGGKD